MNSTAINRTEKTWNPKHRFVSAEPLLEQLGVVNLRGIDWLIAGGESGCSARPFDVASPEDLQRQCAKQGTAFFAKQLGAKPILDGELLIILNGNGRRNWHAGDPSQWPKAIAGLRIRELPPSMLSASGSAKHGKMVLAWARAVKEVLVAAGSLRHPRRNRATSAGHFQVELPRRPLWLTPS
jgi:hypothetical protein